MGKALFGALQLNRIPGKSPAAHLVSLDDQFTAATIPGQDVGKDVPRHRSCQTPDESPKPDTVDFPVTFAPSCLRSKKISALKPPRPTNPLQCPVTSAAGAPSTATAFWDCGPAHPTAHIAITAAQKTQSRLMGPPFSGFRKPSVVGFGLAYCFFSNNVLPPSVIPRMSPAITVTSPPPPG